MPDQKPPGRIITFYSYKGGTGRSMAVANIAWMLALAGRKVLVVDWDLEAPGLHRYFGPFLDDPQLTRTEGLIDFVVEFVEAASQQDTDSPAKDWYKPYSDLTRCANQLHYDFPGEGTIEFVPAGRQDNGYPGRVNSFNWKHFYEKLHGSPVLEEAARIMREEYDFVLIDSRTGVSDTAGICTVQMPQDLVVCFTLNLQSIHGASGVAADVLEQRIKRERPVRIFPIPMRVETGEKFKTDSMKEFAKPKFLELLPTEMSAEDKEAWWGEVLVPYIEFYAFDEILSYFLDNPNDATTVLYAMRRIASRLVGSDLGELPKLDPALRTEVLAKYDAFVDRKTAASKTEAAKTAIYVSRRADQSTVQLERELELAGFEVLSVPPSADTVAARESLRSALKRSVMMLVPVGANGLEAAQREEVLFAGKIRAAQPKNAPFRIYTVLLPGAQSENLPRLLLPYGVIDIREGGNAAAQIGGLLSTVPPPPVDRLRLNPYLGLEPYSADDAAVFFGREALVQKLADAVESSRLVALLGPRGSGKTSCVRAGLIPFLQDREWTAFDLPADPRQVAAEGRNRKFLAVLDLGAEKPDQAQLDALRTVVAAGLQSQLTTIVQSPPGTWQIGSSSNVMTRPETPFLPQTLPGTQLAVLIVAQSPEHVAACERAFRAPATQIQMPLMAPQDLKAAAAGPVWRAGIPVEEPLAERIAKDLAGSPDELAMLQFILARLWSRDPVQGYTLAAYEQIGGKESVDRFCEATLQRLTPEEQAASLRALSRMIRIAEDGSAAQIRARVIDLRPEDRAAVQALANAGIVTFASGEEMSFSHPIFFNRWQRVQQYARDNRDFLVWRQELGKELWRPFTVLTGESRAAAMRWLSERRADLNQAEIDFLEKSLSAATQKSATGTRRSWIALAALLIIGAAAGLWFSESDSRFAVAKGEAIALAMKGDVRGAIAAYERLHASRPRDTFVSSRLSMLYGSTGETSKALDVLIGALVAKPDDGELLLLRGDILAQQRLDKQAQDDYQAAAKAGATGSRERIDSLLEREPGQITVAIYDRAGLPNPLSRAGFWAQHRVSGLSNAPGGRTLLYSPDVPKSSLDRVRAICKEQKVVISREAESGNIGPLTILLGY